MADDGRGLLTLIFGTGAGIYFFFSGLKDLRFRRLIQNLPTSKVRSLAMGLVELKGKARTMEEVLISPIRKRECVFYNYIIEEYRSSGKSGRWVKVGGESSDRHFYLEDDTGKVAINPKKLTSNLVVDYNKQNQWKMDEEMKKFLKERGYKVDGFFKKQYRLSETFIEEGDNLYILGKTKKLPNNFLEVTGEGCKFSMISDHKEEELWKNLMTKIILKVYGGAALTVLCIYLLLNYWRIL